MSHTNRQLSDDELRAWGNRAEFFSTILPLARPDLDWRTVLTPQLNHAKPSWSQGYEELIIRDFFQEERGGLFIDIGCAWPLRGSTTCYLERKLGWSGIAVDALSEYAPGWATHRPRSKFLNYAVSDRSQEQLTFYRNEWTGVSSLSKQQSLKFGGEKKLTPIKVEAITINDLLKLNDITQVDHLTLDIERSELGALNGFDIQFYQPRLCCVENTTEEILAYFEKNNYQILEKYRKVDKINCYFSPR